MYNSPLMKALLILLAAILMLSQAGNIIRFCETDAITIAFYRLSIAFLILFPFTIKKWFAWREKKKLFIVALMGVLFSLHFYTWIMAIQMTKVANAAICFSLVPIYVAVGAYFIFKERFKLSFIWAMIFGICGVLVLGLSDLSFSPIYFMPITTYRLEEYIIGPNVAL